MLNLMRSAGNRIFVALASVLIAADARGGVGLGIDVLEANGYALLKNKRVGLITNQTGVDSRGVRTRVFLRKNCNLLSLYTPEHGLDGREKAGRYIGSRRDPVTGLTAHSLYDPTGKPTPAVLHGINTLVFHTGLPWIPTSPNIPRWNSPLYYVATGLIGELHGPETGVGGARPFEIISARGVSGSSFTDYMNSQNLAGISFSEHRSGPVGGSSLRIDPSATGNLTAINIYGLAEMNRQLRAN